MSIATEHKHSTKHKTEQHQTKNNSNKQRQDHQWNGGKSIDTPRNRNNQTRTTDTHVTKKYKPLTKQTPVVASTDTAEGGEEGEEHQRQAVTQEEEEAEIEGGDSASYSEIYETSPDYRIYQEGKVNDFFKDAEKLPKTISEVCLVNDHYILVKMPSQPEIPKTEVANNFNHIQQVNQSSDDVQSRNRKLCHYLRKNPNCIRKIAPINEEPECLEPIDAEEPPPKSQSSKSLHCLNVNSCWRPNVEEVEVYQTQTTIHKYPPLPIMVGGGEWKSHKSSQTPKNDDNKVLTHHKPEEVQSISATILMSSLHDGVTLRNCGSLVANNNNHLDNLEHCRKSCPPRRRKFLQCERFHWLLRPFRSKYRKPKPKIQAVVYKSYFVKWTKPPECLHHGFGGVKSTKLTDIGASVLRRCRSAIF